MLVQRYNGLHDFEQKAVGLTLRQIQPWHHKHTIARLCAILPRRSVISHFRHQFELQSAQWHLGRRYSSRLFTLAGHKRPLNLPRKRAKNKFS
jgi:hypothetical protein